MGFPNRIQNIFIMLLIFLLSKRTFSLIQSRIIQGIRMITERQKFTHSHSKYNNSKIKLIDI